MTGLTYVLSFREMKLTNIVFPEKQINFGSILYQSEDYEFIPVEK